MDERGTYVTVESVFIPGGCIKYIQAPDVYWNKPFKGFIAEMYDKWLVNDVHQYTEVGNTKPAPRGIVVEWILRAWQMIGKELIINYFEWCALNLKNDGSEDSSIHCFKEPCAAGASFLKDQTKLLHDKDLEKNPFENKNASESDIEEANASFKLLDEDEEDDFVTIV